MWIAAALLYPLALTWLYFIALADVPAPWPQLAYGLGKAVQFGPALWWLARVRPDLLRPRDRTTRRDLAVGAAFGAVVALALFAVYTGRPFDLLGPSGHAAFAAAASDKAATLGIASPVRFLVLGLFYALLHSGLEEAYWRGLVFTAVRDRTRARTAVWVSSVAFTLHHIVLVTTLLPGQLPLALLLAACVGIGGAAWSVQRSVTRSLLGAWLGHGIVDAAIFAVGGWVLFGGGAGGGPSSMAGMRSTTTRAITWASPYPSATRVPITPPSPHPFTTRTPQPTMTPRATVDPAVPLPVAMSLDEARGRVMSWLDSDHAPRIISADYVPATAVAFERDHVGAFVVDDYYGGWWEDQRLERLPTTLVRVVADAELLDLRLSLRRPDLDTPLFDDPNADPDSERCRIVAWFDALSGERLGVSWIDRPGDDVQPLNPAEPTAAITFFVTAPPQTATPIPALAAAPTPAPTPLGAPVGADNVPLALRDVLTAYPLLPGSTWTWDSTSWEYFTTWSRWRTSETVTGAWRLDDRRIVVRSVVGPKVVKLTRSIGPPLDAHVVPLERWRTVDADGLISVATAPGADHPLLDDRSRRLVAEESGGFGLPIEALGFAHEGGSAAWGLLAALSTDRFTITTPSGRFDDCGVIEITTSAGSGSFRAICPGVGYVETDTWVNHHAYGWQTVSQLVSYDVVLPR
ncbi:MAG: CPBP family intramembrane metalloprotease [Ardenticatenales bacterium]|nr:CPBP family intramembrane metalloprotease [Ardenticatenales bacterium]